MERNENSYGKNRVKESSYIDLLIQSPAPIAIYSGRSLVHTFINEAFSRIFSGREILGKNVLEAFPELEGQPFVQILENVYDTGNPYFGTEVPALLDVTNEGKLTTRYFNIVYTPYRNELNEILGVMATGNDVTDLVLSRKKLEEEKNTVQSVMESLPQIAWNTDAKGRVTYVTQQWFNYTGQSREESDGSDWPDKLHPSDASVFLNAWQESLSSGSVFEKEGRYQKHTGEYRWHLARGVPVKNNNGEIIRWVGTCTDIHEQRIQSEDLERTGGTEQLMVRKRLEESEERLRIAVELAEMGTWEYNPVEGTQYFSERARKIFGFQPDEPVSPGKILNTIVDHDKERVYEAVQHALQSASGGNYNIQYSLINCADKQQRTIKASGKAFFENGILYRFTGTILDITQEVKDLRSELAIQHALSESEQKFRNLIMQVPVGICILKGEDFMVEIANESFLEFAGLRQEEIVDNPLWVNFPTAKTQGFESLLMNVLKTGEPFYGKEHTVIRDLNRNPAILYIDFAYEPLKEADGTVTRIIVVVIDVTDKVLARKKIEESEKELQRRVEERTADLQESNRVLQNINNELEQFTYVSSHDLQEPVRKILLFTDMIKEKSAHTLDEISARNLHKISEAARRMAASIKALLEYTHLKKEEQFVAVNLNDIIREVINDLELAISQKHAKINVESLPATQAIPHQMHQLFYNLITNALKFSKPGVPVEIDIRVKKLDKCESTGYYGLNPRRKYIQISVSDNGIGFESEYAEKIFIIFQRLHNRNAYEGTGIGLSLCKKIVENHHGIIRAESKPGEGSIFHIVLPDL